MLAGLLSQAQRNMQVRLNASMATRPLDTLGARLRHARKQRDLTQDQLSKAASVGQSDISKLERGESQQTTGIARLAAALLVNPLWLETGDGPEPNWASEQHPPEGLAQNVSHGRPTLPLSKVTWKELEMGRTPQQPFELDVTDDALGPDIYSGCVVRLDPSRMPRPGQPVLVRDKHGDCYLREYQRGSGDRWQAIARQRGYAPLDSVEDGLEIIATVKGFDWP